MKRKYALIGGTEVLDEINQFMNERYSMPFHLSEKREFLSFLAIAMRKSLPEQMTHKINRMYVNNPNFKLI